MVLILIESASIHDDEICMHFVNSCNRVVTIKYDGKLCNLCLLDIFQSYLQPHTFGIYYIHIHYIVYKFGKQKTARLLYIRLNVGALPILVIIIAVLCQSCVDESVYKSTSNSCTGGWHRYIMYNIGTWTKYTRLRRGHVFCGTIAIALLMRMHNARNSMTAFDETGHFATGHISVHISIKFYIGHCGIPLALYKYVGRLQSEYA